MTKEDKELLLKYLCMALPYKVKTLYVEYEMEIRGIDSVSQTVDVIEWGKHRFSAVPIEEIKPYLRPMSSMTDKELVHFLEIRGRNFNHEELKTFRTGEIAIVSTLPLYSRHIDWLLEHHFDYRSLIDKGLAIEVTEENNPYK